MGGPIRGDLSDFLYFGIYVVALLYNGDSKMCSLVSSLKQLSFHDTGPEGGFSGDDRPLFRHPSISTVSKQWTVSLFRQPVIVSTIMIHSFFYKKPVYCIRN